ncbi:MAG: DNA polymerase IV [Endomicrobiales bacterium]
MERVIALVDMNSYFASVEQASNPALRGKPIVVCGEGRTVVTTASYEARAYGVKTGMSLPEAKALCPSLICVRGTMEKYVDTSARIHAILLEFTDLVEVFSIDECFMDITYRCRNTAPKDVVRAVKRRIKETLGLLCSVGIGPNKLVAKLASKMQRPDGLVEIRKEEVPALFAQLPVEKMQGVGVGGALSGKFRSLGITTAGQLGQAPLSLLCAHFGVRGYDFKKMGNGEDDSPVKGYDEREQVKSVGHSYTFPRDTRDLAVVRSFLLVLSEKVGVRLRAAGLEGKTVSLSVRYGDFTGLGRQHSLKRFIRGGQEIYRAAWKIFESLLPLGKAVRLVGVSISGLVPSDGQQFLLEDMEKQEKLTRALDAINHKYGEFTVKPSSVLIAESFGITPGCGMVPKTRYRRG